MRKKTQRKNIYTVCILLSLFSLFLLFTSPVEAQRSKKKAKGRTTVSRQTSVALGKLNINASLYPGTGEIALEGYTGAPLKAIQFRVIATSMTGLQNVLPGSSVSDKKQWSSHPGIVLGNPDDSGKRTDTIKIVIFGNGWTEFPSGTSIKLLTLGFQQPTVSGTSADTVSFKIMDVVGALSLGEAANIEAGPETSLNLWR